MKKYWIPALLLSLVGGLAQPADVEVWPYEPVIVGVPHEKQPDQTLSVAIEITRPDHSFLRSELRAENVVGYNSKTKRMVMVLFLANELETDLFVAPGRYEVKLGPKLETKLLIDVKELSPAFSPVAQSLKGNLLFRLTQADRFTANQPISTTLTRVLSDAPGSPYAIYARTFLALQRFDAGQNIDKTAYIGRNPPDLSKMAQQLISDLGELLQDSKFPLRGLILYRLGTTHAFIGNKAAALAALNELENEMPTNVWSVKVKKVISEL